MQCSYNECEDTVDVVLSYDNVQQLYDAMQHMKGRTSHNVFTLTKLQDDGTKLTVMVCAEQNRRDWEGR